MSLETLVSNPGTACTNCCVRNRFTCENVWSNVDAGACMSRKKNYDACLRPASYVVSLHLLCTLPKEIIVNWSRHLFCCQSHRAIGIVQRTMLTQ